MIRKKYIKQNQQNSSLHQTEATFPYPILSIFRDSILLQAALPCFPSRNAEMPVLHQG